MNISMTAPALNDEVSRFPSLAALRIAHSELLKHYRDRGDRKSDLFPAIEEFMQKGRTTGALLDLDGDRLTCQSLLDYWASMLYRAGREPPDATLEEFDPNLAPELGDEQCPYLGLNAFREEDTSLFYGRQHLLEQAIDKLKTCRLLAVIGASGSGKSSVVRAGLIPKLKMGALPGSENWRYYPPMVPGSNPLENLARLIRPDGAIADEWIPQQVKYFQSDPNYLSQLINKLSGDRPAILAIDQFEEIFTLCQDNTVRQAFINNLLGLIQPLETRHTIVLTMRSDFESEVEKFANLKPIFDLGRVKVSFLDASELREAIEKPAELVGLKFEDGLVEQLVGDVLGEPAALPLLQFTLLTLWNDRDRNRVTRAAYDRLGGGRRALARSADDFYDALIPEEQVTVKRILLKMARPTAGLEVTSNRVRHQEIYRAGEASDRVDRVLDKLSKARLVRLTEGDTPEDTQVEIAHEALLRNWPRLGEWLEEERTNLRQRLRLTDTAEEWKKRGRPRSMLLRGALLEEAQRYDDLNGLETNFIRSSKQFENRKLTLIITSVSTSMILLAGLAAFGFWQAQIAKNNEELARKNEELARNNEKVALEQSAIATKRAIEAEEISKKWKKSSAQIVRDGKIDKKAITANETEGYQALLNGDLAKSRDFFGKIFKIFPSYRIVEEIYHQFLTEKTVSEYESASPAQKGQILRQVFQKILERSFLGVPENMLNQIRDRLAITVVYFRKESAPDTLANALQATGFNIEIEKSRNNYPSNTIWFGEKIDLNTIKFVAKAAIEAGIKVKSIQPFENSSGEKAYKIEIGANPAKSVLNCPNWTVDDIQKATQFSRDRNGCLDGNKPRNAKSSY